jgi:hypothetical protein
MKSTIADIRQLFNVKAMAFATTQENLANNQFGIFAEGSNTSIAATIDTFAELPARFNIVSKVNGKTYYSLSTIEKSRISNIMSKNYVAPVANEWETTITYCECATGFSINIGVDEAALMQRDGLTWAHRDFVVGFAAEEIDCQCIGGVLQGRDNNVLTKLAVEKINGMNSPYYEAEARNAANAVVTDIDAFIATNAVVNGDGNPANNVLLKLVIKSKIQATPVYEQIDVNYVYPRGTRISPSISVNDGAKNIPFTQLVALGYEIGAGYDLRAEEWENMNYYTTLNYYPRLSDGITARGVVYQFDNNANYDTLSFEFETDKVEKNNGDSRLFGVIIGGLANSAGINAIQALFTA